MRLQRAARFSRSELRSSKPRVTFTIIETSSHGRYNWKQNRPYRQKPKSGHTTGVEEEIQIRYEQSRWKIGMTRTCRRTEDALGMQVGFSCAKRSVARA